MYFMIARPSQNDGKERFFSQLGALICSHRVAWYAQGGSVNRCASSILLKWGL